MIDDTEIFAGSKLISSQEFSFNETYEVFEQTDGGAAAGKFIIPITLEFRKAGLYRGSYRMQFLINHVLPNWAYPTHENPEQAITYGPWYIESSLDALTGSGSAQEYYNTGSETVVSTDDLLTLHFNSLMVAKASAEIPARHTFRLIIPFAVGYEYKKVQDLSKGSLGCHISARRNLLSNKLYCNTDEEIGANEIVSRLDDVSGAVTDVGDRVDQAAGQAHEDAQQAHADADRAHEDAEKASEERKGILETIADFFGSFFYELMNLISKVFVPDSEDLQAFLTEMKQFLEDHLGILMFPFTILERFVQMFINSNDANNTNTFITLPSFSIMGHKVWGEQKYNLYEFANSDGFSYVFDSIKFVTSIAMIGAFLIYAQRKLSDVLGGGNE